MTVLLWNETQHEEELECIVEDIVASANGSADDSQHDVVVLASSITKLQYKSLNRITSAELFEFGLTHISASVLTNDRLGAHGYTTRGSFLLRFQSSNAGGSFLLTDDRG